ncbi:MAG: rod shape-determining protein, partial [Lachnospiraceae bacterium]|nr:rod shape-determining protein [Lachnospiraceae bacterium]
MPSTDIGIDLGTSNIVIWFKGKGIIVREPTMVAYDKENDRIVAYGEEARQLVARSQGSIVAIRPFKAGTISDYSVTEKLLWHYIQVAMGRQMFRKPYISICMPSGVTEVEKRAAREAATQAGGKDVFLMEEPLAAAIGAGLDVGGPQGNMVMDIGGGT